MKKKKKKKKKKNKKNKKKFIWNTNFLFFIKYIYI